MKKTPDASNAKEYYKPYLKRKNTKLEKWSKIITQQTKTVENRSIVDIKSVIIEPPKVSHKLSKAIRQAENFSQVSGAGKRSGSSLNSKTKKVKIIWMKKMQK